MRVVKCTDGHGQGQQERDKLLIMAGKWSFVWTYLEEDGHLRGYLHMTVNQAPRNATLAEE